MRSISAVALAGALFATPTFAADVIGVWRTETNDKGAYLHVQMYACGGNICGRIIKNVNGQMQHIVGQDIIKGMAPDGANKWDGGTIWKPDDDETYDAEMELKGDVLEVSGCVLGGIICSSQDWVPVK